MSLRLEHVSYAYDCLTAFEKRALEDINIYIEDGDFLGIAGPSGSGKTTLAKILSGLISPGYGKLSSGGLCAMAFQYPEAQLFEKTVLKDIMFGPLNMGKSMAEAKEAAKTAMAVMNLCPDLEDRNPLMLSGGEKRRVALAGVLSMNPDVLILDEPCAGLDMQNHDALFSVLHNLNEQGKTIILISHELVDIAVHCKTVLVLNDGRQSAWGNVKDVFPEVQFGVHLGEPLRESFGVPLGMSLGMSLGEGLMGNSELLKFEKEIKMYIAPDKQKK